MPIKEMGYNPGGMEGPLKGYSQGRRLLQRLHLQTEVDGFHRQGDDERGCGAQWGGAKVLGPDVLSLNLTSATHVPVPCNK